MNFESILPLLRQGKKIRRKSWASGNYIQLRNSLFLDQNNDCYTLLHNNDILADNWELYQETMTFEEAIKHFKNCKKITRLALDKKQLNSGQDDFYLTCSDILASDWIIVEK